MAWATRQKLPVMQKIVLLMLANRTNHDTGRCDPSHERLADDCGMSKDSVKRAITELSEKNLVQVVHRTQDGVCLPNHYLLNLEGVGADSTEGWVPTALEVGADSTTKQEVNLEVETLTLSELNLALTQVIPVSHETFERFWSLWPRSERKVAKDKCLRYWRRSCLFNQVEVILNHVEVMKGSKSWQEGFIPQPYTYLNQRRWEVEADEQQTNLFKGVK